MIPKSLTNQILSLIHFNLIEEGINQANPICLFFRKIRYRLALIIEEHQLHGFYVAHKLHHTIFRLEFSFLNPSPPLFFT
jgi:hypothetical protein